jgi:ATP-dependent protease ClpP protease subunit
MKRLFAVAIALLSVSCAPAQVLHPDDGVVRYSAFPPTTVEVQEPGQNGFSITPSGVQGMIEIKDVDAESLAPAQAKFDERVAAGDTDIWFRINSFGGSIFDGMDFIQHIGDAKVASGKVHVTCVVDTKAMSMGFVFLETFCDSRYMTKRSLLLAHNGSTEVKGTVEQILSEVEFLKALNESLATTISDRLGMPVDEYKARVAGKDWTMSWEEAMRVNAVDSTINPDRLPPLFKLEAKKLTLGDLLKGL